MLKKRWPAVAVSTILLVAAWNYPLTYRVGVNGKISEKKIPLYAKASGFIYRDWMYKDIVRGIVGEEERDLEKVLAIFRWVNENVRYGVPAGLKSVDDHPLNIIIRQYGGKDQMEDIFTLLCSYAGLKADRKKCYNSSRNESMILSFVYVDGRRLIFDAARNKYFFNRSGGIGSVEDYYNGDLVMSDEEAAAYKEFLADSRDMDPRSYIRIEEQMPFRRIQAEIKKFFIDKKPRVEPSHSAIQ